MNDPEFSPASACIYSFEFPRTAQLGDIIVVEIEGLSRVDFYYAEGINQETAKGRLVMDPLAGELKARYPNSLYVTLLNKDVTQTPLDQPITVNYWLELVDPTLKAEEYSNGLIPPSWVLEQSTVISTKKVRFENDRFIEESDDAEEDGTIRILIMIFFIIAFIFVCGLFITYYVMMSRKKTM